MLAILSATTAFGFGMIPSSRRKNFYFRDIQVGDFFNPIDPLITTNISGFGATNPSRPNIVRIALAAMLFSTTYLT